MNIEIAEKMLSFSSLGGTVYYHLQIDDYRGWILVKILKDEKNGEIYFSSESKYPRAQVFDNLLDYQEKDFKFYKEVSFEKINNINNIRKIVIDKVKELLEKIPEEYYCSKCGYLVVNERVASLVENQYRGYYDICECDNPKIKIGGLF